VNRAGIVGMGLWVPQTIRRNDAWPASFVSAFHDQREARRARDFTDIERSGSGRPYEELFVRHALPYDDDPFKGATERRVAPPDVPTVEGDAVAAQRALEDAGVHPRDVDLVLSSALIQDELVPSNGPAIQDLVGCVRAPGIGVEAYCSSALAQLDLAASLVESGRAEHVLCVQSHQLSRVNDMTGAVSPIFGDASAAMVVGRVPEGRGLARMVRGGDGSLRRAVAFTHPAQPAAVWWKDPEGPIAPGMLDVDQAKRLARRVLEYPIHTIRELCEAAALPLDAVAAVATIQPLVWYTAAIADGLGISAARVPSTYPQLAHIGGAGVVANLLEARRLRLLRDGAPVILYAHGAGITRYAALLHWHAPA
jgi:3-oxoacyl-[acyl-carrier-protein] synthase III